MDLDELEVGDYVVAGSAFIFLVSMFLPWYGLDFGDLGTFSNSGWDYFLSGMLPLLLAIVMVVQIVLDKLVDAQLPELPWGVVHLAAGVLCAVILLLRVLITSSEDSGGVEVDLDRMYGVFLALLAAIGLAVGGFLKFQESGGASSIGGSGSSTGTPTQF